MTKTITIHHYPSLLNVNNAAHHMINDTVNEYYLANPNVKYLVAEESNGLPVGVLAYIESQTRDRVCEIFIEDDYRSKGIGKTLMMQFEQHTRAPEKCLTVYAGNEEAVRFYEALQYEPEDPNRSNIVMVKTVKK
jgi:GNAT superfamily N-acetyltransferase